MSAHHARRDTDQRLDFSFLRTAPWLFGLAVCVLFAIACHHLAQWQWDRRVEVMHQVNRVLENYDDEPISFAENPRPVTGFSAEDEWTPVTFEGEYLVDETLIVRNRPRAGSPGYEVLVPFRTDEGTIVMVNRGWLQIGNTPGRPDVVPQPDPDAHTVTGRLRPGEPALDRDAPEGQVASIDLPAIEERLGEPIVRGAYVQMMQESPAADRNPQKQVEPTLDEGPHLSYALQWYLFALMGFAVWGYSAWQKARNERLDRLEGFGEDDAPMAAQRRRQARAAAKARARMSDEAAEDAAVDAAEQVRRR